MQLDCRFPTSSHKWMRDAGRFAVYPDKERNIFPTFTSTKYKKKKKNQHTSPSIFWESRHETLRLTCFRIPMCSRNVNNAAKLCSLHIHSDSTIHAPKSLFPFSPALNREITLQAALSRRLISVLVICKLTRVYRALFLFLFCRHRFVY